MRNAYADFGVSVYGGLVAVWIAERDDGAYWDADWRTARSPRAQRWLSQIAARFDALGWVVLGTTIGMMIANVPAVLLGEALARRLPLTQIRWAAAVVFILTGLITFASAAGLAG